MFSGSVANKIPIIFVFLVVIFLFMNHSIKEKAFYNAVDENLIKNLMVGSYIKVSKDDLGYVICTEDNIKEVTITDKFVDLGLFEKSVMVDFDITIESSGKTIKTTGYLNINYSKKSKLKWDVERRILRNENVMVYE